jgi:hypothetical protein
VGLFQGAVAPVLNCAFLPTSVFSRRHEQFLLDTKSISFPNRREKMPFVRP